MIGKDVIVGEIVDFEEDYFNTEFWCRVEPETVGQLTGLKDRHGREICEGDIMDSNDSGLRSIMGVVDWRKGRFVLANIDGQDVLGRDAYDELRDIVNSYNVIGNIHDNPELLEGE